MQGKAIQRRLRPRPPFKQLRGQFHRIPLHAINAGHRRHFNARQQVMQAMAKLMKQRDHIVVGQQAWAPFGRRRKVAGQIGHRRLLVLAQGHAGATDTHPSAALFAAAGIQIDIQASEGLALGIQHMEKLHTRMPGADLLIGDKTHTK